LLENNNIDKKIIKDINKVIEENKVILDIQNKNMKGEFSAANIILNSNQNNSYSKKFKALCDDEVGNILLFLAPEKIVLESKQWLYNHNKLNRCDNISNKILNKDESLKELDKKKKKECIIL